MAPRNAQKQGFKDGRRASAGRTKLVLGGDENRNAKEGLCFLSASATYVPSPSVKSSLVPSPSNREVSEIMGVSDQGQVSKLMMAQ